MGCALGCLARQGLRAEAVCGMRLVAYHLVALPRRLVVLLGVLAIMVVLALLVLALLVVGFVVLWWVAVLVCL